MNIETFAHYRESAHHHGRHLDTMLWNIIRTVLLLGSIILAGATQLSSLSFTWLDGILMLLPLILAFVVNLHSLGSRPLLVPHPDVVSGSPRLDDPGRARRAHRYCMDRAFEENRARKHSIMFSVASVGATLSAAGMWLGVQTASSPSLSDYVLYWALSALLNTGLLLWSVARLWGGKTAAARVQSEHLLQGLVIDIEGLGTDVADIDAMTKQLSSSLRRIQTRLRLFGRRRQDSGTPQAHARARKQRR